MINFIKERANALRGIATNCFNNIYIETIGVCTNKCIMCPTTTCDKTRGIMSNEMFEKIIAKLKEINYSNEVHLYAQNEPFLDKDLIRKIYYVHEQLPDAKIIVISNFTFLNDNLIDEILKAPVFNFSNSLYALDRENYKKIYGRDNFNLAFTNLIKFIKKFALTQPYSFALYLIDAGDDKLNFEFAKWLIFDFMPVSYMQNHMVADLFSTKGNKLKQTNEYYSPCIYNSIKVTPDGVLSTCLADPNNLLAIGSIDDIKTNIQDYYNNDNARKLRRKMFSFDTKDRTNYCQYCDFRRAEKVSEFLFGKKMKEDDRFNNKLRKQRLSKEEVSRRLIRFNEIFKDGDEDNWINALDELKKEFMNNNKELTKV